MASVILFGGGDGGGLIIGPNGVRPIPPFDPGLRRQLKALGALTQALRFGAGTDARELVTLTTKLSNHVVGAIEGVVGQLDAAGSLVYQDDDGGFSCGSTGLPPIPFPWPPRDVPGIEELVTDGVLEHELVRFLNSGAKLDVKTLLQDPHEAAEKAGIKLSKRSIAQLEQLSPSRLDELPDDESREVVRFFNRVVEDGRFLDTWSIRPHEVARNLGVELSDAAISRIVAGGNSVIRPHDGSEVQNPIAVAVAIGIVIMLVDDETLKGRIPITDRSGLQKF